MSSKSLKDLKQEYASKNNFVESENISILDLKRRYNAPNVAKDIKSRLEQWNKDSQSLLDGYNSRFFDKDGQYITDTFRSSEDAGNWLYDAETKREALEAETNSIKSLLTDYGEYFDENIIKDINNMLDGNTKTINSVVSNALIDKEYWDKFENETAWKESIQAQKDYEALTTFDLEAGWGEISELEKLKAQYDKQNLGSKMYGTPDATTMYYNSNADRANAGRTIPNNPFNNTQSYVDEALNSVNNSLVEDPQEVASKFGWNYIVPFEYSPETIDEVIAEKRAYYNRAKYIQDGIALTNNALNAEDFGIYNLPNAAFAEDRTYKYINNIDGFKASEDAFWLEHGTYTTDQGLVFPTVKPAYIDANYEYMTNEEKGVFNYYYSKFGKEKAYEYIKSIEKRLNTESALKIRRQNDTTFERLLFGIPAGLDQFTSGVKNLFNSSDDYIVPSDTQIASGMIREDLKDSGFKIGKNSIGQIGYDLINTTSNMLPSILTSTVVGWINPAAGAMVGSGFMGASASGNAYAEMLNLGYDKGQARVYSLLVGGSEAGLQYLLGGIGKLGGAATKGVTAKIATKLASNVDKAFAKIAITSGVKLVGSMVSEFGEEYLQEVLTPVFKNIALGTDEDVKLFSTDALYAGFLGALSAALLEGGSVISGEIGTYKTGKSIVKKGQAENLAKLGMSFSADTVAHKIASKVNKDTDAYTLGQLLHEVGADHLSAQNIADITAELERKGMTLSDAQSIAKWLNKAVEGGVFTKSQRAALENNEIIDAVFRDVILNRDSSVNQRVQLYQSVNENLAQERTKATATSEKLKVLDETSPKAEKTSTNVFPYSSEYIESVAKVYEEMGMSPEQAKNMAMAQLSQSDSNTSSSDTKNSSESKFEVSDDGKTINLKTGETVAISKIDSISESGEVKLTVDNGVVVKASDVSFGTVAERAFIEEISNLKLGKNRISTASANALYQNAMAHLKSNPDMTLDEATTLIKGLAESYIYGAYNFGEDRLTATDENGRKIYYAGEISDSARRLAYKLGQNDSVAKAKADQKVIDELVKKAKDSKDASSNTKKGRVRFEKGVVAKGKLQKRTVSLAKHLAKIIGIDIVFYDARTTTNPDGKDANGYFDEDTNTIYLDLQNSHDDAKTIAFTLSHELVHFIKKWSSAKFDTFARFLMEQYTAHGVDSSQLLAKKMVELGTDDVDFAYEEMICDACETMLLDSKVVFKLMELRKTDLELFDKIKLHIYKLLNSIRGMYKSLGLEPTSDEAKALLGMKDVLEQIYSLFEEASVDAVQSYQAVQTNQISQETGFVGKYTNRTYTPVQAQLLASLSVEALQNAVNANGALSFNHIGLGGNKVEQQAWIDAGLTYSEDGNVFVDEDALLDERDRRREAKSASEKVEEEYTHSVKKQAKALQKKDPTKLKEEDLINLLEFTKDKVLSDDTYIPVRVNTPQILIAFAKQFGYTLDNHPLAMQVYKARQAVSNEDIWDGDYRDKPHDLSPEDVVGIIRALNTPSYLVFQTENERFAEIVKFKKENSREKAYAIIDFYDVDKNPDIMNGYKGGKYNILVTVYPSENVQELKEYLSNKKHKVLKGEEMKKKDSSQGSYGGNTPSLLNDKPFYEDIITQEGAKSQEIMSTNKENPNIRYQKKTRTNRSILANSLESAAQNDIERKKLAQYKEKISLIEAEEKRLAEIQKQLFTKGAVEPAQRKKLQFEARQISNRINIYDRQLLNLESTAALKNVLNREKALAMKKQKQKDAELLKQYREKAAKNQRELIERHQESRKKATESRHKTAMRHQIKNVVNELNQLLLKGSKDRNVKLGLQSAVASALEAVNMDTIAADERIAKLKQHLMKAKTPEKIQEISRRIDNIREQGGRMASKLEALKKAYENIKANKEDSPEYYRAEASLIEERIASVIGIVGDTPLRNMSLYQLEAVYDLYSMVLATVRNANSVFVQGKLEDLQKNAADTMEEISAIRTLPEERVDGGWISSFSWNEMIPIYAFRRIGSQTFEKFFWEAIQGQNTVAKDLAEANDFAKATREKYGYSKWDLDKVYEFELADGRIFRVTLKHMMSIYAYSKRHQALDHMTKGGFFFNDKSTFRKKGGVIKLIKSNEVGYCIGYDTLETIIKEMSDEQIKYVDEMQTYLTKMGDKGNEVSRVLWGIDIFKEKVYFPLKSVKDFIFQANQTAQESSLKNDGMTKETKPGASNPIVLEAFDDVWANHVNRMSQYHGLVLPIENLNKIHNYGTWSGTDSVSVSTMLKARFGEAVNDYVNQFIKDLNGASSTSGASNPFFSFVGKFKKTAVAASASVVVQQPTAIIRATAVLDSKYFVGMPEAHKLSTKWNEVKKYAPIAIIKEIGGFDAGAGRQATQWLNSDTLRGVDKVAGKIDDITMIGAAIGDQIGWCAIWEAVKRKVKATTNLEVGSEEFLNKVGERFTEVIVLTQVYDSTLSRSGFMRSKHDSVKMLTSFMGEPTVSFNMMLDATAQAKRGTITKRKAGRIIGAVYASIIAASVMASLIYALRDDDEDESYIEKFLEAFGGKLLGDINPLNMLPGVRDIISIFDGWDVERTDMAVFKDIKDAFDGLSSESKSPQRKIEDFAGAIASAFGLPLKNALRSTREVYNGIKNIFDDITPSNVGDAFVRGITGEKKDKSEALYNALVNGDEARLKIYRKGYKDDKTYETALRKALRENDPRIKKAAEARFDGDFSEYERLFEEIEAEGNFEFGTIRSAIDAEFNKLDDGDKDESSEDGTGEEKIESIYRTFDINVAFENGDTSSALEIIGDIVKVKTENYINDGEKKQDAEKKAKSSVKSSMTNYWKPLYINAYQNKDNDEMKRIRNVLLSSGLYGRANDVVKTGQEWIKSSK